MLARRCFCWLLFLFSLVLVACAPPATEPGIEPSVNPVGEATLADVAPPVATQPPGPYPPPTRTPQPPATPELPEPTDLPESTPVPVPTLPATPVVTPIPTAVPPIIPFPEGTTSEPFTLYYRDGDVIRSLSSTGDEEAAVLFDPATQSELYLSPRIVPRIYRDWGDVSPDGKRVALVLAEVPETPHPNEGSDRPAYSSAEYPVNVYILERESEELRLLVENAIQPLWSPDGLRLAYLSLETWSLWVMDVENGQATEIYAPEFDPDEFHMVRGHTWAPDSRRLALVDDVLYQMAALLVVDVENPGDVRTLVDFSLYSLGNPQWSPTGDAIAFTWSAGEGEGPHLWEVDPVSGEQ